MYDLQKRERQREYDELIGCVFFSVCVNVFNFTAQVRKKHRNEKKKKANVRSKKSIVSLMVIFSFNSVLSCFRQFLSIHCQIHIDNRYQNETDVFLYVASHHSDYVCEMKTDICHTLMLETKIDSKGNLYFIMCLQFDVLISKK